MCRRFVVLLHEHSDGDHWDFMLETAARLTTWAVPPLPLPLDSFECQAKILPDHRLHYLDYEGPISDNRGTVRRIDAGIYETVKLNCFRLHGEWFDGTLAVDKNIDGFVTLIFEKNTD